MKSSPETPDWPALIAAEPAAALVPSGLRDLAQPLDAAAGATLFRSGDPVRFAFLLLAGEAQLTRLSLRGAVVVLQRSRGGFFAEASLDTRRYHCDAVAAQASRLLRFPVSAFRQALAHNAAFCQGWQSLLAQEVRKLRAQCERLSLNSAAERIGHYIESEGRDGVLQLSQTRKSWAAELGLSHESLYRTLKRMQGEGSLAVDGNQLALMPVPGR
jgi:CRP-like cAMP-binding protein